MPRFDKPTSRYQILGGCTKEQLQEQVDEVIALGWTPVGGPILYVGDCGAEWYQAVYSDQP